MIDKYFKSLMNNELNHIYRDLNDNYKLLKSKFDAVKTESDFISTFTWLLEHDIHSLNRINQNFIHLPKSHIIHDLMRICLSISYDIEKFKSIFTDEELNIVCDIKRKILDIETFINKINSIDYDSNYKKEAPCVKESIESQTLSKNIKMKQQINILLVDDHQTFLEGLKLVLRENENQINIIGEAHNKREAIKYLNPNPPDIILLDTWLERAMDGIELACELNKNYPHVKIIIISHYKDIEHIISALRAGIHAYLAKDATSEEVNNTINSVYKEEGLYLGETLSKQTIKELINNYYGNIENQRKRKPYGLSKREIEIIEYMAKGFSSKEIATNLSISETTVETHKGNIKIKLDCNTAIEMVVFAITKKIITVE